RTKRSRPSGGRAGQRVGELRRPDERREERRRREVGHAEAIADEVARRLELGLDAVERGDDLLPAARRARSVDPHVLPHDGADGWEQRTVDASRAGPEAERQEGDREIAVGEEPVEDRPPDVWAELDVEVLLELERAAPGRLVAGVERWVGMQALERLDDARRVGDRAAVEHEHRYRSLSRQPEHPRDVERGKERAADVRDALPVERPARLLVVVGEAELPEDRALHGRATRCPRAAPGPR